MATNTLARYGVIALGLFLLPLAGCSGGNTGAVHGTVTVDGVPTDGLELQFVHEVGSEGSMYGFTHEGGQYHLIRGRGKRQVPIGEYRVTMSVQEQNPNRQGGKLRLGPEYTQLDQTELTATVTSGDNEINFDLTP